MDKNLTKQQQSAVVDRGGALLVSAAAGSGKTKVLVERVLEYLTDPASPAELDQFLIITFTKAAASELRGKIAEELSNRIAAEPENKHLQQQMQRLYLTKISTVHSFCGDVLREYAYRLDIPADFRVADEQECEPLQQVALERVLENAYENAGENEPFCTLIDTQGLGRNDQKIPQIMLQVYRSAMCHPDPEKWLDSCLAGADGMLTDVGQTVWGSYLLKDLHRYLDLQIQAMTRCAELASRSEGMEKPTQVLQENLQLLLELRQCRTWDAVHSAGKLDYGKLSFGKKCPDIELQERIKAVRDVCKKGVEKKLQAFSDCSAKIVEDLQANQQAMEGLIALVRSFRKEYDRMKQVRRILDFNDLEHKMLELLLGKSRTAPTAAANELEQRFCQVMVDEYQDSNEIQDAIYQALTYRRHNIFMVGDVKQSIYQFRLAEPQIFIDKYNHFEPAETAIPGQGRKVILSSNFRSSGGVIEGVNAVFHSCMSPRVGGLVYGSEEQLNEGIPHIDLPEPEVELYGIQAGEDTYEKEAAFTAARIAQLLDGKHYVRSRDVLRPITEDDIVILLRSPRSVGGEFRYALEQKGIRSTTGDKSDLLLTEEIGALRSVLQVISNPLQDIPLIAALSSRLFCFTADDLARLRSGNRKCSFYEALSKDQAKKSCNFVELLNVLRMESRICSVTELLDRILDRTNCFSIYGAMEDGDLRQSNIEAFYQFVSDFESTGQKDLEQLLDHLDMLEEEGLSIPSESTSGAVKIMSIHKSKGLEFPVVFLCGLSRRFNLESAREQVLCHKDLGIGLGCVDSDQRVRYPGIAKRAIAARMTEDSISEEMRILYVAMTRAQDRLIMTYAQKNLEKDIQSIALRMELSPMELMTAQVSCPGSWVLLTALRRTEAGALRTMANVSCNCTVSERPWHIAVIDEIPAVSCLLDEDAADSGISGLSKKLAPGLQYRYPYASVTQVPSKQTATQLKGRYKDREAAELTVGEKTPAGYFRKPTFACSAADGRTYGNALHEVMEHIDFAACSTVSAVKTQIALLRAQGQISQTAAELADPAAIAAFFASPLGQKLQSSNDIQREFKFSVLVDAGRYYPDVQNERVLLQGVVDCFILEQDGITVVDFKTDRVTDQTLPQKVANYRPQVEAYCEALGKIYALPVKNAYLHFFCTNKTVEL